ncbi:type IV secretion system protein [Azospirillum thermophilum]|uniref:P-type conjugative transfer protein TrbJ n=1 Tax=Azospirillum thermophilum TaxID=2202148 RepID=A0A2S2CVW3_9PROT|nr:hypothetical protein [Azospirillum thermophilum]AWK88608.1 hypothetical protein DEW08_21165 [Azospirillum thermophilum]
MRKPLSAVLLSTLAFHTLPAKAQGIPVIDVSAIAQMITQVSNQVQQISNQVRMIENQARSLQTLGGGNFGELNGNLTQQVGQLNAVMNRVQGIGYQLGGIEQEFNQLFPAGTDWQSVPTEDVTPYYQRWSAQLQDASRTAMDSQGVVRNVQRNVSAAQGILADAQASDGEVRQLQATNEMLALLATQLGDMTMTMATTGRVTASAAAAAQAKADAEDELRRRFLFAPPLPSTDGEAF